jgi:hypothetical protein
MLCKSCRPSHKEHNKIGFAIFGFFYDFYMQFTSCSQNTKEGKESFYKETPGKIQGFADIPQVCTNNPGKNSSQAM